MINSLKSQLEALYLGLPAGVTISVVGLADELNDELHIECGNENPYQVFSAIANQLPKISQYHRIRFYAKSKEFGTFSPVVLQIVAQATSQINSQIKSFGNSSEGRQYPR